ncbi:MAG: DUF4340 domain-containing protein [Kiritimatiellae bacterium]|nr:DUF4340 domain-containing protein [Kiritimatiellia bacterium]
MKSSGVIIKLLLSILLILTAHLLVSLRSNSRSRIAMHGSLLPEADDAVAFAISRPDGRSLAITNAAKWKLTFPVSGEAELMKVAALKDALGFTAIDETLSDSELARLGRTRSDFGLDKPRLTVEAFTPSGVYEVEFGDELPAGDGVYAARKDENLVFVLPKSVFAAADVDLNGFRRRQLVNLSVEEVSTVDIRLKAGKFLRIECNRATNERFNKFLGELLEAEAKDFIWPVDEKDGTAVAGIGLLSGYGLDPETALSVTLHGVDGADRTVSFGKGAGDGLVFASVFGGSAIVTVDAKLKEDLEKGGDKFSDSRLFPVEAASIDSITINDGGVNCLLHRLADGSWQLESPVSAPADRRTAGRVAARIAELNAADRMPGGVLVSISTNREPVEVNRDALFGSDRMEDLRSLDIVKIPRGDIKRLVVADDKLVFNPERKVWMLEESDGRRRANESAVARLLTVLEEMKAKQVVRLKVSDAELSAYGLDRPTGQLAVDLTTPGVARKNILVGARTADGWYATVGAADAVFVISDEIKQDITGRLVE